MDSNVLVSIIGKKSRLRPIWDAFIAGHYSIAVSEDILKEYEEILQEHSAPGAHEYVMEIFTESPDVFFQNVYYNWNIIPADADDNKFFDVAVAANADLIVTNDRHFDAVKNLTFPKVNIASADDFLRYTQGLNL
ncbi:putative toxin-antitoxin system toxin component, PIN family [bacterium A37T11]|nr:putative toxin-antitoxin system toxin component, PIN family [bacterium A37T11]